MGWVYIKSEPGIYTVGFFRPNGVFESESDHDNSSDAADRVSYLNGNHQKTSNEISAIHNRVSAILSTLLYHFSAPKM